MSSHTIDDLTSCILDFQANMVRVTYRKKTTLVEPDVEATHNAALQYIWTSSRMTEEEDVEMGGKIKWRKLGFDSENMSQEFSDVGVLGLDCLVRTIPRPAQSLTQSLGPILQRSFAQADPDFFSKVELFALIYIPGIESFQGCLGTDRSVGGTALPATQSIQ